MLIGDIEALPAHIGNRRQTLTKAGALLLAQLVQQVAPARADVPYDAPTIRPNLAPKQGTFDPTDEDLRDAAALLQRALNAEEVQVWPFTAYLLPTATESLNEIAMQQEEALLTELITKYEQTKSNWVPDVVGRAYGNRGNARSRQGKLVQSLEDYNTAIRICPWSGDPVLNRYVQLVCAMLSHVFAAICFATWQ